MGVDNADIESIFQIMRNCVECITQGDEVFTHDDFDQNELQEFFDNLNTDQFTEIQEFFVNIPRVKSVVNFECSKCGHHNERELAGLQDFFG